jgi:hypothetical protein
MNLHAGNVDRMRNSPAILFVNARHGAEVLSAAWLTPIEIRRAAVWMLRISLFETGGTLWTR